MVPTKRQMQERAMEGGTAKIMESITLSNRDGVQATSIKANAHSGTKVDEDGHERYSDSISLKRPQESTERRAGKQIIVRVLLADAMA